MIVRESIEFKRGGESPLKSLRIGQLELLKKELEAKSFGWKSCKENIERISRKYARKSPSGKVYFKRELSDSFEQFFGPDFKEFQSDNLNPDPESKHEKEARSDKSRQFFKKLIKKIRLNDSQISDEELLDYINEFTKVITPDPLWFEAVVGSFSYTAEMY